MADFKSVRLPVFRQITGESPPNESRQQSTETEKASDNGSLAAGEGPVGRLKAPSKTGAEQANNRWITGSLSPGEQVALAPD
ncbi:MAG: hypothetical protein ACXWLQ_05870, partial [Rhizomicrobium sp.]